MSKELDRFVKALIEGVGRLERERNAALELLARIAHAWQRYADDEQLISLIHEAETLLDGKEADDEYNIVGR